MVCSANAIYFSKNAIPEIAFKLVGNGLIGDYAQLNSLENSATISYLKYLKYLENHYTS